MPGKKPGAFFNKAIAKLLSLMFIVNINAFALIAAARVYAPSSGPLPQGQTAKRLRLQYGSPAADNADGWRRWSLPIGNGYQGANIFGRVDKERVQLSEESLWGGGPIDARPGEGMGADYTVRGSYPGNDARAHGNVGRDNTTLLTPNYYQAARAAALGQPGQTIDDVPPDAYGIGSNKGAVQHLLPTNSESLGLYQNFAEVYFHMKHDGETLAESNVVDYIRWLDIENATAGVEYNYQGITYSREYFASYPDHVVAARFTASQGGKVSFTLNPAVPHKAPPIINSRYRTDLYGKVAQVVAVDNETIEIQGYQRHNGMRFAAQFKVIQTGGAAVASSMNGDGTIEITGADEVIVVMSYGTNYENNYDKRYRSGADPMVAVRARASAAVTKSYAAIRENHIRDYTEIFSRVELDLGGTPTNLMTDALLSAYRDGSAADGIKKAMEELYFQYGRYLLIASSREGSLPANLQGVWNMYFVPSWQSDYHLNINLQMNYWPANNTNMRETLTALLDYVDSLRKPGRVTARNVYGVGADAGPDDPTGWVAHVSSNPFGYTGLMNPHNLGSSTGHSHYAPESAAWLMQNIYNIYQYYPDKALLRDRIYPMLRETSLFFSDPEILVRDPVSGRMVMSPSYSSEHGPMWAGATFQQQLLWQLFTDTIEASGILEQFNFERVERPKPGFVCKSWPRDDCRRALPAVKQASQAKLTIGEDSGPDGLRQKLMRLLPQLADEGEAGPVPIGSSSGSSVAGSTAGDNRAPGVKEWWWETSYFQTASGPVPSVEAGHRHLSHLVGLFPGNLITKGTPEWMEAAKNSLNIRGDGATGWSRGMKINLWARTGDGNHAYTIFNGLINEATFQNLWDYHTGTPAEGSPNGGVFQIDGNLGGTAGIAEMLMQSHTGYIEPLPALPDAWPSGRVKGLTARGGFEVGITWSGKKVDKLIITSNAGQDCTLLYGNARDIRVNGGVSGITVDNLKNTATFSTVRGKTYVITLALKQPILSPIDYPLYVFMVPDDHQ